MGGSPTGPDPENRVGHQDIGSPVRTVSSGLQVPGELLLSGRAKDLSAPLYLFPYESIRIIIAEQTLI
jgi:hypothetical protein